MALGLSIEFIFFVLCAAIGESYANKRLCFLPCYPVPAFLRNTCASRCSDNAAFLVGNNAGTGHWCCGLWNRYGSIVLGSFPSLTLPWLTAIPGDAVLKSQAPAILATFFTEKDEQSTAMANAKLWQSLGFAAAFTTGPVMTLWVQSLVTLALWLLASASMWYLHRRVASIDSSTAPSRP